MLTRRLSNKLVKRVGVRRFGGAVNQAVHDDCRSRLPVLDYETPYYAGSPAQPLALLGMTVLAGWLSQYTDRT